MSQLICFDIDHPKEFSDDKILFDIISKHVESTLVSYKSNLFFNKKEDLLKNNFKIFFRTEISEDYVYGRQKFSGCEML